MLLDRFNKQPNARKKYQVDFTPWMDDAVAVTDVVPTITVYGSGEVTPTLELEDGAIVGGTVYEYFLVGGTNHRQYKLTLLVTFSDGQIEEWEVEYRVEDI